MTSPIPVNDLARYASRIAAPASERAAEVIRSGYYVLGPWVQRFEAAFAAFVGTPHCIGVGNGTDALEIALRAIGVGAGDRVVVAANAAMYGTGAVLAVGAEPVFADVDPVTSLVDAASIERAQSIQRSATGRSSLPLERPPRPRAARSRRRGPSPRAEAARAR